MKLNMNLIQQKAEAFLDAILENCNVKYEVDRNSDTGSLTLKTKSIGICGYDMLLQFMFMEDGEVYFFALLDELEVTAENASLAFEASTTTPICVTIDDYLTFHLGSYLFDEAHTDSMMQRYMNDMIYLIEEDDSTKALLARMH